MAVLARWLTGAAVLLGLLAVAWSQGREAGAAAVQQRWDSRNKAQAVVDAAAERDNRTIEFHRLEAINAAIENARSREALNLVAADAVRAELDGLRGDLARAADARRADVSSNALKTCRGDAAARDSVLDAMAAAGAALARNADGHASDALTLDEAWPNR